MAKRDLKTEIDSPGVGVYGDNADKRRELQEDGLCLEGPSGVRYATGRADGDASRAVRGQGTRLERGRHE